MSGKHKMNFFISSVHAVFSLISDFKNLTRLGVKQNKSLSSTVVPISRLVGLSSIDVESLSNDEASQAISLSVFLLEIFSIPTAAIEGNASPRNPKKSI